MGQKLLPLSIQELCAHALALERDAGARFREYAGRMRELGSEKLADTFDEMSLEQDEESNALQSAAGEHHSPADLSPWEHLWRLTYLPDGSDERPHAVPRNAREALQLAALAKRRAEIFYRDVEEHAPDNIVRSCAAEMAATERRQIRRLEQLLWHERGEARARESSGAGDARSWR
jgi:rubrerythrin